MKEEEKKMKIESLARILVEDINIYAKAINMAHSDKVKRLFEQVVETVGTEQVAEMLHQLNEIKDELEAVEPKDEPEDRPVLSQDEKSNLIRTIQTYMSSGDADALIFNYDEAARILTDTPTRDTIKQTLINFTKPEKRQDKQRLKYIEGGVGFIVDQLKTVYKINIVGGRRPTKRRRHTKKTRPTKRRRHTKRIRHTKRRAGKSS